MAPNLIGKIGIFRICRPISFVTLPFRNGMQYRNSDFKRLNRFLYIVYNFAEIWSSNPRVYAVNNNTFCGDTAKII